MEAAGLVTGPGTPRTGVHLVELTEEGEARSIACEAVVTSTADFARD
jgi:hypothetical protein